MNCPGCNTEMMSTSVAVRRGPWGFIRGTFGLWFAFERHAANLILRPGGIRAANSCPSCKLLVIEHSKKPSGHGIGRFREFLPI